MGFRAWDMLHDPDYLREVRAWHEDLDAAVREETELAEKDRDRYPFEAEHLPLLQPRGT